MSVADYHKALRAEIGEEAYLARCAAMRAKRQHFGGPWRKDYVDKDGRTGIEIAAAAGRKGKRKPKQDKEL
jgi:hypothetical protein